MAILFSKLLTDADLEKGLTIPSSSVGALTMHEGQTLHMHVHDINGQEWIFACCVKERSDESHAGAALSLDWLELAREKKLKANDRVVFLVEEVKDRDGRGGRLILEVKRKIRLFGEDIWADVK